MEIKPIIIMESRYNNSSKKIVDFLTTLREQGMIPFLKRVSNSFYLLLKNKIFNKYIRYYYFKVFKSQRTFDYNGSKCKYFYHKYNTTHLNERAEEIAIIKKIVSGKKIGKILEVGNVLQHYISFEHDIIDKYEKGKNVINRDIIDFFPESKYDLILSISTLEHIGFDDGAKDPDKILITLKKLNEILSNSGKIVVTIPLGYNPYLDNLLKERKIFFNKLNLFKRISFDNEWVEEKIDDIRKLDIKYGDPYITTNWLLVGEINKNNPIIN